MFNLDKRRVESKYAWLVAVSNCWINFSIYALYRSYGVLFIAFKDNYNVAHQTAAWPFTLFCSIYHLIGPIVGHLSHYYSLRSLQITGVIIASIGVISCTFVTSFINIIILLGVVQGLGLGVLRTLSNVIIQMYFKENRATATGIAMAGGTISSFFFPPLAEFLVLNYGLKICYLLFGLLMLQAVVPLTLQTPPSDAGDRVINNNNVTSRGGGGGGEDEDEKRSHDDVESASEPLTSTNTGDREMNNNNESSSMEKKRRKSAAHDELTEAMCITRGNVSSSYEEQQEREEHQSSMQIIFLLTKTPIFWVISLTFVTYNITLQIFLMTIVDVTIENNITDKITAVYLIPIFSLADLIGRVSFGWISDKGFLKTKTISVICHLILTLCLLATPTCNSFIAMALLSFTSGLIIGILTILWPLLNVDYFGTKTLPFVLGMNCFLSGTESVFRPFVIGYFLDTLARYDLLYYTVASSLLITTLLWLLEPCIHLTKSPAPETVQLK